MGISVKNTSEHWLRTFAVVWCGQAFSLLGSSLVQFALVWWLTGLAPEGIFFMAVAGFAFAGFMGPIANGPIFAILQAKVSPEMQGRVFTLLNSSAMAMMPLSMLVAAPVAEFLGVRAWFLIGGGVTTLVGALAFFVPAIMNLEDTTQEANAISTVKPGAKAVAE
jgi:hypothetical protein